MVLSRKKTNKLMMLPNEIWLKIFRMIGPIQNVAMCALVCTTWCKLIHDEFIKNKSAKEIIHPSSSTFLRRLRLDREWISPCLTFISGRCQHYAIEELEINGLTYADIAQFKDVLQKAIEPKSLRRIIFYDAFLPLEKYTPFIFNTFPNLSEFTVAFPGGTIFKRRSQGSTGTIKTANLYRIWLRLRDDGFEIATNATIATKLIQSSPHLKQLFLESIATHAHEDIINMWMSDQLPELKILGMTHDARIRSLLAHPIVKEINKHDKSDFYNNDNNNNNNKKATKQKKNKKKKGLKVLVLTEDHIQYHHYDFVEIHQSLIAQTQDTLELLYLENLYPSSHVTWPELLGGGYGHKHKDKGLKCPQLRQLVMHLGKTSQNRSNLIASIHETDFEGKICILLSNAPHFEKFTYRRDLGTTRFIRESTYVTDLLLDTLIMYCSKLTTFQVSGGCSKFTWDALQLFFERFKGQLSVVELDCTIIQDHLQWMIHTLTCLKKISIRHICNASLDNFDDCSHIDGHGGRELLSAWNGSFEITKMNRIDQTLYDIS